MGIFQSWGILKKAKEFTHGSMNEMSCITAGVEISFAVVCDWHGLNSLPVGILVYFVIPPQNRILFRSMNYSSVQCFKGTWCHLQCKSTKVLAIINRTLKPSKVIVLCSWGKHFTVIRPLSIKGYKWVQVNFQGSLMKCRWVGGLSCIIWHSIQGGVVILLVASCDRNLDKLLLYGYIISLSVDFTFKPTKCRVTLQGSDPCFSGHSAFQAGAECTAWLSSVLKLTS